jgi:hypothetical protein
MEGDSMKRAQSIQRGRSSGRGYLPAKVHMRTRGTRRVIELNRVLVENREDADLVSKGEMPMVQRALELWQGQSLCAHNTDLEGFVPTDRNTDHLKAVRVNTQTVESPWKAIQ